MLNMDKKLTRKQIKEGIIQILWVDLIERINDKWKMTQFNILKWQYQYIVLGTDTTDWFGVWVSINDYDLLCREFWQLDFDEYKLLEKAIDFLTTQWSDEQWNARPWFLKYMESDYGESFIFS